MDDAQFFTDSKGSYHLVLLQSYPTSCGPACVGMVIDAYKKICSVDAEGHAIRVSQRYPGHWSNAGGTQNANLVKVLNAEGVKAYGPYQVHPSGVYNYLKMYARLSSPAIVGVTTRRGQQHVVVCPAVYPDGTVVFLDPATGLEEEILHRGSIQYRDGWLNGSVIITYR